MTERAATPAYALADSRVGLLGWKPSCSEGLDDDFVLTNVKLSWLTGTSGSAVCLYYEAAHATQPTEPTTIPTAVAAFGGGRSGIRRFADRDHRNVVRWMTFDLGGHFAPHKATDLLAEGIRAFFGRLR